MPAEERAALDDATTRSRTTDSASVPRPGHRSGESSSSAVEDRRLRRTVQLRYENSNLRDCNSPSVRVPAKCLAEEPSGGDGWKCVQERFEFGNMRLEFSATVDVRIAGPDALLDLRFR